ncbi:MAG TPA: SCO family protein [Solirubrobacteraceae bacterium]|nr:SCO family protein [Solirubrobacteraceae bacterium]
MDEQPEHKGVTPRQLLLPAAALVAVTLLIVLFAFSHGATSNSTTLPGGAHEGTRGGGYYGIRAVPVRTAPEISGLHNDEGKEVRLGQYRGKAVFLTFIYTHCPNVCPLIAAGLHRVVKMLGPRAAHVQVMAVSVDPRGDTPAAVKAFLAAHQLTGEMQYLIGSAGQLAPIWKQWGVGAAREVENPDLVAHTALVYGISATGKITTIYSATFQPYELVHDASLLAAE